MAIALPANSLASKISPLAEVVAEVHLDNAQEMSSGRSIHHASGAWTVTRECIRSPPATNGLSLPMGAPKCIQIMQPERRVSHI